MRRVRESQRGIEGGGGGKRNCIGVNNSNNKRTKDSEIEIAEELNHWQRKWGDFFAEGNMWVWSGSGVV